MYFLVSSQLGVKPLGGWIFLVGHTLGYKKVCQKRVDRKLCRIHQKSILKVDPGFMRFNVTSAISGGMDVCGCM